MVAMGRNGSLLFPCCRILLLFLLTTIASFLREGGARATGEVREVQQNKNKKEKRKNCAKEEGVSRMMEICCGSSEQLHQHTSCKRLFAIGSIT